MNRHEDQSLAWAIERHRRQGTRQNRVVRYFHVTPWRNIQSILDQGLLTRYSQGRIPVIWLCAAAVVPWALRHVRRRHETDHVAVLTVQALRTDLLRYGYGRWFSRDDLPPASIVSWREE
jgi:hypothetical protein